MLNSLIQNIEDVIVKEWVCNFPGLGIVWTLTGEDSYWSLLHLLFGALSPLLSARGQPRLYLLVNCGFKKEKKNMPVTLESYSVFAASSIF